MKKFVQYIGYKPKEGTYFTTGLTLGKHYEFVELSEQENFVIVINDLGEEFAYSIGLFK